MYPIKRSNDCSTALGSDGNSSMNSLVSNDSTVRINNNQHHHGNHISWDSGQVRTPICYQAIADIALKRPDQIEWNPQQRKITIHKMSSSFEISFKMRPVMERHISTVYVIVKVVTEGSQADRANLLRGDLVLSLNGHPTHCVENHVDQAVKEDEIEKHIYSSGREDTMVLIVQSPIGVKTDVNANSSYRKVHNNQSINRNHSYIKSISTLQKLPYSKIVFLGEDSTLLAKQLFGEEVFGPSTASLMDESSFHEGRIVLQGNDTMGTEPKFRKLSRSYRSWLTNLPNLDQTCNGNNSTASSMFVDIIVASHRQAVLREATTSFFMSGNEVYVYQVSALRMQQETQICLDDLQSSLNKINNLAGHKVPIILAVTSNDSNMKVQDFIINNLRRFIGDVGISQIEIFSNDVPCIFVNMQRREEELSSESEFDSLLQNPSYKSEHSTEEAHHMLNLRSKILKLLWERKYLSETSTIFLKSLESFWKMVDSRRGHKVFLKRDIQDVLQSKSETNLTSFVRFLALQSELLPARPGSTPEFFIPPKVLLRPFLKLLQPPATEEQALTHWKILSTIGIASAKGLGEIFHEFTLSSVLCSLQHLDLIWPLSRVAMESNVDLKRFSLFKEKLFFLPFALKPAHECKCIQEGVHSLLITFEDHMPPGFLEQLMFILMERLTDGPVRWKACHRGCFEITVGNNCVASFNVELASTSIRIYCSFPGINRPMKLIEAIRKSIEDIEVHGVHKPILGFECPLKSTCQRQLSGRRHIIELDTDRSETFMYCGSEPLQAHPVGQFWLSEIAIECSPLPSSSYSKPWDCVRMNFSRIDYSKIPAHPDELSNLSPTIYMWLCDKLNVLDKSRHLDWRMVASELGYKQDDMDQFDRPDPREWNPSNKLFQTWIYSRKSSISGLISLLRKIGREDMAYDFEKRLGEAH